MFDCARGREFRRVWWRLWWGRRIHARLPETAAWARRRLAALIAWWWLRDRTDATAPAIAAAEAAYRLNRHAKTLGGRGDRHEVYALKHQLIRALWRAGVPCEVTRQQQRLACYGCRGTGTWQSESGRYADWCWRCGGTGTYRVQELLRFAFRLERRDATGAVVQIYRFTWHQPAEKWPELADLHAVLTPTPYVAGPTLPREQRAPLAYEIDAELVARYVEAQGLALGTGWARPGRRPRLRAALAADARAAGRRCRNAWDWRWRPRLAALRERLVGAGAEPALADEDLPF